MKRIIGSVFAIAFAFSITTSVSAATTAELEAMIAQLQAQLAALSGTTPQGPAIQFNMDLTVGSTGADVAALQQHLVANGYLQMPAGVAYGYFGGLTQAAVAKWQLASGIAPAAGYFGPISRAYLNASVGTTPTTPTTPGSTGDLSGGEASLEDFELNSEESSGDEGEEEVEIATAEFDVEDGDARIERVEVDFQADNAALGDRPWDYFESVSLWVDGEMVDEMDTDSRTDWDEDDADSTHNASASDWYRLTFTGLDYVVHEGDAAQITIAANIAGSIDTADLAQNFEVLIDDEGVRATDAIGIQQYTGDDSETVSFGFGAEESGDLDIETSSDDPDSMTLISDDDDESEDYTVFVWEFDNNDDADSLVTDLTIDVATTSTEDIDDIIDTATLLAGGDEHDGDVNPDGTIDFDDIDVEVAGDSSEVFELMISFKSNAASAGITFSIANANVDAEGVTSGDDSTVSGSATSEEHTVATTGILVEGVTTDSNKDDNSAVGTYEIEFTVEALEDTIYIYNGADQEAAAASTTGITYNIYKGGSLAGATTTDSALLQSSATQESGFFRIDEGESETFTLTVTVNPTAGEGTSLYFVELEQIYFDDANDGEGGTDVSDTQYTVPNDNEFETGAESLIAGTDN